MVEALLSTVKRLGVRSHILALRPGPGSQIVGLWGCHPVFLGLSFFVCLFTEFESMWPAGWEGGGGLEYHII